MDKIHELLQNADFWVFNGDIFDFRWSTKMMLNESVTRAIHWLKSLIEQYPTCNFHYIIGNHDNLTTFVDQLRILADKSDNLNCYSTHFILGSALFIHGDLHLTRCPDAQELPVRQYHDTVGRNGRVLEELYQFIVMLRIHRLVATIMHRPARCAKRIMQTLENDETINSALVSGQINRVYFGHTHYAFTGYIYRGITFINTGSAIRGLKFNMQRIEINETNHG